MEIILDTSEVEAVFGRLPRDVPAFIESVLQAGSLQALREFHSATRYNWITGQFHASMDIRKVPGAVLIGPQTFADRRELWVALGIRGKGRVKANPYPRSVARVMDVVLPKIMLGKAAKLFRGGAS